MTTPGYTAIAGTRSRPAKPAARVGPHVHTKLKDVDRPCGCSHPGTSTGPSKTTRTSSIPKRQHTAMQKQASAKSRVKQLVKKYESKGGSQNGKKQSHITKGLSKTGQKTTRTHAFKPASPFGPETRYIPGKHTTLGLSKTERDKRAASIRGGHMKKSTECSRSRQAEQALVKSLQEEVELKTQENERIVKASAAVVEQYQAQLQRAVFEGEELKRQQSLRDKSSHSSTTCKTEKTVRFSGLDSASERYTKELEEELRRSMEEVVDLKIQQAAKSHSSSTYQRQQSQMSQAHRTLGSHSILSRPSYRPASHFGPESKYIYQRHTPSASSIHHRSIANAYERQKSSEFLRSWHERESLVTQKRSDNYAKLLEEQLKQSLEEELELKIQENERMLNRTSTINAGNVVSVGKFPSVAISETAPFTPVHFPGRRSKNLESMDVIGSYNEYSVPQSSELLQGQSQDSKIIDELSKYTRFLESRVIESMEDLVELKAREAGRIRSSLSVGSQKDYVGSVNDRSSREDMESESILRSARTSSGQDLGEYTLQLEEILKESLQEETALKLQQAERIAKEESAQEIEQIDSKSMPSSIEMEIYPTGSSQDSLGFVRSSSHEGEMSYHDIPVEPSESYLSSKKMSAVSFPSSSKVTRSISRRGHAKRQTREASRRTKTQQRQQTTRRVKETDQKVKRSKTQERQKSTGAKRAMSQRQRSRKTGDKTARKYKSLSEQRFHRQHTSRHRKEQQKKTKALQQQRSGKRKMSSVKKPSVKKEPSRVAKHIAHFERATTSRPTAATCAAAAKPRHGVARGVKPATHFGPEVRQVAK